MGALEAPQDRHGQEHRTGTSRAEQTMETMAVQGAQEAMAGGLRGRGLVPRPGHSSRNPSTPPQNFHGAARGIRSPVEWIHRLGLAAAGGHESGAILRA